MLFSGELRNPHSLVSRQNQNSHAFAKTRTRARPRFFDRALLIPMPLDKENSIPGTHAPVSYGQVQRAVASHPSSPPLETLPPGSKCSPTCACNLPGRISPLWAHSVSRRARRQRTLSRSSTCRCAAGPISYQRPRHPKVVGLRSSSRARTAAGQRRHRQRRRSCPTR